MAEWLRQRIANPSSMKVEAKVRILVLPPISTQIRSFLLKLTTKDITHPLAGALLSLLLMGVGYTPGVIELVPFFLILAYNLKMISEVGTAAILLRKLKHEDAYKLANDILTDAEFQGEVASQTVAAAIGFTSCLLLLFVSSYFGFLVICCTVVLALYNRTTRDNVFYKYSERIRNI